MHESSGWLLLIFASIAASILAQFFQRSRKIMSVWQLAQ